MNETISSAVEHAPGTSPARLLAATIVVVHRVLEQLPDNRLEARRLATREWGFDASPEQLQLIVRLAHDEIARQGASYDLACATLAARILIERVIGDLIDENHPDAERVVEISRSIPDLRQTVDSLDQGLATTEKTLGARQREFLNRVRDLLIPARETMLALEFLAPHLERRLLAENESSEPAAERSCLAATVLNAAVLDAVLAWDELAADPERQADASCDESERESLLKRMRDDRLACSWFAGRLRRQLDAAVLTGLEQPVKRLRRAQRDLAVVYRRLAAALNEACPGSVEATAGPAGICDLERLLAESAAQDAMAETERTSRVAHEELFVDALKGKQVQVRTLRKSPKYDVRRERLRIRLLTCVAAVMLAGCAASWTWHLSGRGNPLAVPMTEISDTLILDDAISVGPMMYAVVSHWSWDNLSDEERLGSVRALGLSAANNGYESVYLVDEKREELAVWTKDDGAELKQPKTHVAAPTG